MKENQLIPGINAIREALIHDLGIHEIWMIRGKRGRRLEDILGMAEERGIPVSYKKGADLDQLLPGVHHQGVIALAEKFNYADLGLLIKACTVGPSSALIVAADHITDEGNLGALIRTAAFFGTHGLILPKDRSAQITEKVLKRSSGAAVFMPVVRVTNLRYTLDHLAKKGFWIIGAAGEGMETIYQFDWNRDVVLVLGREDRGLTPVIRKRCHQLVSIPSKGILGSLNVAVAGGIILSEIMRQRETGT